MPHTERVNFSQRFLDNVRPPAVGRQVLWDSTSRGLGVTVQATGTKTYFWARRVNKKLEWHTIGSADDFTLEEARNRADQINAQIGKWKEAGSIGPVPIARPAKSLTLGALFEDYCTFHLAKAKNPAKALESAKWFFNRYLATLRPRELASITRAEVRDLHARIGEKHGPVGANRALQLFKAVVNFGIESERFVSGNVAVKLDLFPEYSRERTAQKTELQRLFAELDPKKEPSRDLRNFVWLALLTGARKGDVLSMKWDDLALEDKRWTVPATTKSGRPFSDSHGHRGSRVRQKRPLPGRGRLVFFAIVVSAYSSSASKWKKAPFCSWPITA